MMQKFKLVLKNEKVKQHKLFSLLIIIINILFLAFLAITSSEIRFRCIAVIILIAVLFIIEHFSKKKNKEYNAKAPAILIIIVTYLTFKFWLPVFIMAILAVLYIISERQLIVYVNSSNIIYPSFTKKTIEWKELSNILLKDGLLTIDFKNNKIIQQLIEDAEVAVNEKEFNDFCRAQLESVATNQRPD